MSRTERPIRYTNRSAQASGICPIRDVEKAGGRRVRDRRIESGSKPGRLSATGLARRAEFVPAAYSATTPKCGKLDRRAPSPVRISSAILRNRCAIRRSPLPSARNAVRRRNRILSSTFIVFVIPVLRRAETPPPPHHSRVYLRATPSPCFTHTPNPTLLARVPLPEEPAGVLTASTPSTRDPVPDGRAWHRYARRR